MIGTCGNEKASDAIVEVNLSHSSIEVIINSKLKKMYGHLMVIAVESVLQEMNVTKAKVEVSDFGALDFVIRARTKTAIRRALAKGGQKL